MKKSARTIILIILIIILGISLYKIGDYYYHSYTSQRDIKQLIEEEPETSQEDTKANKKETKAKKKETKAEKYKRLKKQNNDIVGWIKIADTKIDYPVMWTPSDPEKYLYRNFEGEYSGWGLPFVDEASLVSMTKDESDATNTLIHGHHMKDGTMFHCLTDYEDQSFYEEHKIIKYTRVYDDGSYKTFKYLIIGACKTELESGPNEFKYYKFANMTEGDIDVYLGKLAENNLIKVSGNYKFKNQFITLSTCSFHVEGKNGRFFVIARLLK